MGVGYSFKYLTRVVVLIHVHVLRVNQIPEYYMNTVQGFCDFNIPVQCYPTTTLKDVVLRAVKLGYSAIAINTVIQEDVLIPPKKKGKKKDVAEEVKEIPPPPTLSFTDKELSILRAHGNNVKILQRLTVTLSDPSYTQKLIQSVNAKRYDLLAVLPTTTAAFQHAAANMEVDIITYDPSVATEVRFNRKQYRLAADRGIYFELSYSSMLRDSSLRKKNDLHVSPLPCHREIQKYYHLQRRHCSFRITWTL